MDRNNTSANEEEALDRIVHLIRDVTKNRQPVGMNTEIYRDLGLWGDDAGGLLDRFSAEFGVDMAGFDFSKHFREEGSYLAEGIVNMVRGKKAHEKFLPVTVRDLVASVLAGKWVGR